MLKQIGLGMLVLCAGMAPLRAAVFCVSDEPGLQSALVNASSNGEDNDVKVEQGTYALSTAFFYGGNGGRALRLLGGYQPGSGCAAGSRAIAPANTIFDASAAAGGEFLFNAKGGDVVIEGVRWTKLSYNGGAPLQLHQLDGFFGGKLVFRFNEVDHSTSNMAIVQLTALNEVELSTNLVHNNTAPEAVLLDGGSLTRGALIVHNTISANSGVGLHTNVHWQLLPVALYNNILYGNGGADRRVSGQSIFALNNTTGTAVSDVAPTFVSGSSGNVSTNPNLSPSTFAPLIGSPAINSGVPFADILPAQDIAGVKRVYGSAPDRGAFEAVNSDFNFYLVKNTNNSGVDSLREAIHLANLGGIPALIQFQIGSTCGPGGGPQVITLSSALENITVPMVIQGYTQPGSHPNTLATGFDAQICIMLSGNGSLSTALRVPSGKPAARLDVSGVVFTWFSGYAVVLSDGKGHYIHGNSFGVDAPGTGSVFPNGGNLILNANALATSVGGATPAERNLLGSAGFFGNGLNLASADSYSVVRNNYIGSDANGTGARANTANGILVYASQYNLIADNLISGNDGAGIEFVSSGVGANFNTVQGNRIGLNVNGAALGNGFAGIWLSTGAQINAIGSSSFGDPKGGNSIGANGASGVLIDSTAGSTNTVFANAISTNTGIAIDLDAQGPLANDILDVDAGPNGLQNYPVITRAIRISPYSMHVEGSVSSKAHTPYYISIYANAACDASGFGPAQIPVGTFLTGFTDASGHLSFNVDVGNSLASIPTTGVVTATATDTTFGTSEINACHGYLPDQIFQDGFEAPAAPPPGKK